jgi:outer membrane protein
MKVFRKLPLSAALALALGVPAQAQSLVELFESARAYDATYQAAKAQYEASKSKADQALALLLPTSNLVLSANRSAVDYTTSTPGFPTAANTNYIRWFTTQAAALTASQPIYRPANLAGYYQSKKQLSQALTQLVSAEQELVVRISQAYFDVLASQDSLEFVRAQKTAVSEQLASAKRNFEVGTATITDTREAQARFDLVIAQEIAAENDLRVKKLALDQWVGIKNANPKPLAKAAELKPAMPEDPDRWVQDSETTHPGILNAQLALDIAKLEIERARAGHKPTVDLQAGYSGTRNLDGTATSGSVPFSSHVVAPTVSVVMTVPLFAGFATENRYRETVSLEEKAKNDLEAARRNVAQATRAAYFGVVSGIGQVKALEAAEESSQVALDANKLGYTVGVRINIDVLNSQSQLFQTKRDLAKARYDVLVGGLKLRQANGTLKIDDLQSVNALLSK